MDSGEPSQEPAELAGLSQNSPVGSLSQETVTMVINRNDNIKRRLDRVLGALNKVNSEPYVELVLVGRGGAIGKLVSITEIVKGKATGERGARAAKLGAEQDQAVVDDDEIELPEDLKAAQYNYLDYVLEEKKGGESRELALDPTVKVPVVYTYLCFYRGEKPEGLFERLEGWTEQD